MGHGYFVKPGSRIDLGKVDPDGPNVDKQEAIAEIAMKSERLRELLELMYAAGKNSLLVVLQGRDTAGKDGTIRRLLDVINVQGTKVASFKVPTALEIGHDFLWRVHSQVPVKGATTIFNRSHYEDVLVVRVHDIAPEKVWRKRYQHINAFEELLTDSGTLIAKFMLHISKEEQEERLLDREKDETKAWKLAVGDWKEREFWGEYTEAYEDALAQCSTEHAPWTVVPANHKWLRDLIVVSELLEVLEPYEKAWREHLAEIGRKAKEELDLFRASTKG